MKKLRQRGNKVLFGLVLAFAFQVAITAQIFTERIVDGKHISCVQSGLFGAYEDCGTAPEMYATVFVGSIKSVERIGEHDFHVRVHPEEVFSGTPSESVDVITDQGDCLPELKVADRWLFYLRQKENGKLILSFDDRWLGSRPVEQVGEQLDKLRRLIQLGNFGIVEVGVRPALRKPGLTIQAKGPSGNVQAIPLHDGEFEFPPLLSGKYVITTSSYPGIPYTDLQLGGGQCKHVNVY